MIKTGKELAAACVDVAQNHKTLYVFGGIGGPLNAANKQRAKNSYAYNRKPARVAKIDAASADTFGFDCVCMVKSLLWGWCGDASKNYGGASYKSNGVPDVSDKGMLNVCTEVTEDFTNIMVGEYLWMQGHCGIYIGGGLAVECTPIWKDGVQITAVHNIGTKAGYNGRKWTKHGKLPYISYPVETPVETPVENVQKPEKQEDYTLGMRNLRKGCIGEDVRALQILLKGNGYDLGTYGANKDGIDSDYGGATERAVIAYQKAKGLQPDGIAGRLTMGSLMGA